MRVIDLDELERNDVEGSLAYYEQIRPRLLKALPHQRSAMIQPLLMLHDDPRSFSRVIKAKYPED